MIIRRRPLIVIKELDSLRELILKQMKAIEAFKAETEMLRKQLRDLEVENLRLERAFHKQHVSFEQKLRLACKPRFKIHNATDKY